MKPIYKFIIGAKAYGERALDTILPPRCPVTGDIVSHQGLISPDLWAELSFIADPHCQKCGYPFEYLEGENDSGEICSHCMHHEQTFTSARSAIMYNDAAKKLITRFKHGDQLHALPSFVPWLMNAGRDIWPRADVLIPVPLHPWRLIKRRYNQAGLIADALARQVNKPCYKLVLKRDDYTASQGHLSNQQRHENVKNVFSVNPKKCALIDGKSVVLVDDVYTTGATVSECAKILLENGASSVHIITIARALMPGFKN